MPKFNFNLRNPQATGPTPVYLIIRYQKKYRVVYPTGERILPARWDKKKQRQKSLSAFPELKPYDLSPDQKKEYHTIRNFNLRLDEIQLIARQIFEDFIKQNDKEEPEPKEYKLLLDVELEKMEFARKDLFAYTKNFIEDKRMIAVEKGIEHHRGALYKSYGQLYAHMTDYSKFIKSEIDFKDIDIDFYYYFADFLRNQKKLLPNTIGKHIKSLKSILNSATENGINSSMIYRNKLFKVITEKVDTIFLDQSELALISELDLSGNTQFEQVKDVFIISARTGLLYSEFSRIHGIDQEKSIIEIANTQSDIIVSLPLQADLISIIRKYKGAFPKDLPPVPSTVLMNASIKQICKRIPQFSERTEIDLLKRKKGERKSISNAPKYKLITMQTARRSFFRNQYRQGVNVYLLMAISGHKSHDNFLKFIHVTPVEHARNMKENF